MPPERLCQGKTLNLNVEFHWPRVSRYEGPRGRVSRKEAGVDSVDGRVESGVAGIHAHHHYLVQRGARTLQAALNCFERRFGLGLDVTSDEPACLRVKGR